MQEHNLQGKVIRSTDLAGRVTTAGRVRRSFRHARRIQKLANSAAAHYSPFPIHSLRFRHYEPVTGRWMQLDQAQEKELVAWSEM